MKTIILLSVLFIFLLVLPDNIYSMESQKDTDTLHLQIAENKSNETNKNTSLPPVFDNSVKATDEDDHDTDDHDTDDHDHSKESDDNCGVSHLHDPFILAVVEQEPWRHPEKLMKDMWLMRTSPVAILFLLSIILRPPVNKLLRRVSK